MTLVLAVGLTPVAASGKPSSQSDLQNAVAVIPLVQCENKLYVPARINGVDVGLMMLDTGSKHTTVRPPVAAVKPT